MITNLCSRKIWIIISVPEFFLIFPIKYIPSGSMYDFVKCFIESEVYRSPSPELINLHLWENNNSLNFIIYF
jgi:hypothetical protein